MLIKQYKTDNGTILVYELTVNNYHKESGYPTDTNYEVVRIEGDSVISSHFNNKNAALRYAEIMKGV
jgi:hypothetical protein